MSLRNSILEIYRSGVLRRWRWRVRAANGEIVSHGQSYRDKRDAYRGFEDARDAMNEAGHARELP